MTALQKRKIDRSQVLKEVSRLIQESNNGEIEISSSDLSDRFGVQAPTMDYHLNKLVEDGSLSISPKRGRYNRKIYRLPSGTKTETVQEEHQTQVHIPFSSPESEEKYNDFINRYAQRKQTKKSDKEENHTQGELLEPETTKEDAKPAPNKKAVSSASLEWKEEKITPDQSGPEDIEQDYERTKNKYQPVQTGKLRAYMDQELTLDEEVQRFLEETNRVHDAEALLKHEDREILSVMNETINQTTVYLKDLSEQLSTVANKQLIQHLIDDRNRMQAKMERLEKDAEEARKQVNQTKEQYEIEPERIRFMQQLIISTVDDYVNQTNQSLALGRREFRNKVSKEVKDLVSYVLRLES